MSGKKISDLSSFPSGTPASQLFFETARQISPGVWAGESEQIGASDLITLLSAAGAALSVNITSLLNDRGSYSPTETYTRYDFVSSGGSHYAYINPAPSSGNTPPNITHWVLISVDGKSSIATITNATPPAIPAIGQQVTYTVDSSAGFVLDQLVAIGAASTLKVVGTPTATSILLENIDATPGAVAVGAKISPTGSRGANAFTTVTTQFTIPAFNAQVAATVGSTAFMSVDMALQISGKFFRVASITNATTVSLVNSVAGQTGTIAATSRVVVAGATGSSSGTGLQFSYLNTAGTPATGQIRTASLTTAGAITISSTDAQGVSTTDILNRLKVGAIIEIAKDINNRVRGSITADYASGTNSFSLGTIVSYGTIASGDTLSLNILSGPASSSGGTPPGIAFNFSTTVVTVPNAGFLLKSSLASTGVINISIFDTTFFNSSDILNRLKVGAIIEIAKDSTNRIRASVTVDYASNAFTIGTPIVYGTIATGSVVYLSILSDAAAPATPPGVSFSYSTIAGTPAFGQLRAVDLTAIGAQTITISTTDSASKNVTDFVNRLKIGAIIEIGKDSNNRSRAIVTSDYNSTTFSVNINISAAYGVTILNGNIVYLSILSDAPPSSSGGSSTGLQYTHINTAGTPTAGQIRSADIALVGASTVSISATDAQSKSAADVLARLKVGAIIEIAKDAANRVRGTISGDYAAGTNSFNWSGQFVYGAIANNNTVYLSIVSDAPSTGSGGHTVQDETTNLPQRTSLSFVGAGVTATDDPAGNRTVITVPGGSSGAAIALPYQATDPAAVAGLSFFFREQMEFRTCADRMGLFTQSRLGLLFYQ